MAMFLLQLAMMLPFDVLDKSFEHHEGARRSLNICADDITFQVAAAAQDIVYQTVRLAQRLVAALKTLDLPIARDKTKALSSDFPIGQQVARRVRQRGVRPFKVLEVLRTESRGGNKLKFSSARARAAKMKQRLPDSSGCVAWQRLVVQLLNLASRPPRNAARKSSGPPRAF